MKASIELCYGLPYLKEAVNIGQDIVHRLKEVLDLVPDWLKIFVPDEQLEAHAVPLLQVSRLICSVLRQRFKTDVRLEFYRDINVAVFTAESAVIDEVLNFIRSITGADSLAPKLNLTRSIPLSVKLGSEPLEDAAATPVGKAPWGHSFVGAGELIRAGWFGSPATAVTVIGTGIAQKFQPVLGPLAARMARFRELYMYCNLLNDSSRPEEWLEPWDENGHSTEVASLVCSAGALPGAAQCLGLAPLCRVLPIKFTLGVDGSSAQLGRALQYANGRLPDGLTSAPVGVNLPCPASIVLLTDTLDENEYGRKDSEFVRLAVEQITRRGGVVVCSAGDASNHIEAQHPADYPGVIGVGSVEQLDAGPAVRVSNMNRGRSVRIYAPGMRLSVATLIKAATAGTVPAYYRTDAQGTSYAAPYVAGVIAALWESPHLHAARMKESQPDMVDAIVQAISVQRPVAELWPEGEPNGPAAEVLNLLRIPAGLTDNPLRTKHIKMLALLRKPQTRAGRTKLAALLPKKQPSP